MNLTKKGVSVEKGRVETKRAKVERAVEIPQQFLFDLKDDDSVPSWIFEQFRNTKLVGLSYSDTPPTLLLGFAGESVQLNVLRQVGFPDKLREALEDSELIKIIDEETMPFIQSMQSAFNISLAGTISLQAFGLAAGILQAPKIKDRALFAEQVLGISPIELDSFSSAFLNFAFVKQIHKLMVGSGSLEEWIVANIERLDPDTVDLDEQKEGDEVQGGGAKKKNHEFLSSRQKKQLEFTEKKKKEAFSKSITESIQRAQAGKKINTRKEQLEQTMSSLIEKMKSTPQTEEGKDSQKKSDEQQSPKKGKRSSTKQAPTKKTKSRTDDSDDDLVVNFV